MAVRYLEAGTVVLLMRALSLRTALPKLAILLAVLCAPALGTEDARQKMVKSAFLLNLAKMSQWPGADENNKPLIMCLYQRDLLGDGYRLIRKKKVHGRAIKRLVIEDLTQSSNCDLLYLSSEELRQFVDENEQATRLPILTVADMTSVPKSNQPIKGVHIMLVRREKRIGFAVNLQEAKDVGIGFSSELLKLSTIVGRES